MKPKLLMICLLRSSAAALATHSRGGGGSSSVVGVSVVGNGNGNSRRGLLPSLGRSRRTAVTSSSSSSSCDESSSTSLHATLDEPATDTPTPHLLSSGHIAFRLARRTDVPQIQKCNLATLPENYNANFYINHLRAWPELSLVAEHIPEGCDVRDNEDDDPNRVTPIRDYIRGRQQPSSQQKPRKEIVGYVLGKVDYRPVNVQRQIFPPSRAVPLYEDEETLMQYMNTNGNANGARLPNVRPPPMEREKIGHVTSLAVHAHARRLGIASSLIKQLDYHLNQCRGADSVGLHVRISNKAAVRLYCEEGYDVADIIPLYYGDGEDAYFMRKDISTVVHEEIPQQQQQRQNNEQRQWRRGERERNEWLNRDAARSGSFFDGRKSMRDTLSAEERAWVKNNGNNRNNNSQQQPRASLASPPTSAPSLSGQFRQSFRTFFNGGEQMQTQGQQRNQLKLPPWEVGPEGLRLPRYSRIVRAPPPLPIETSARNGMSLKDLLSNNEVVEEVRDDIVIESSYEEEEESLDARVAASGPV